MRIISLLMLACGAASFTGVCDETGSGFGCISAFASSSSTFIEAVVFQKGVSKEKKTNNILDFTQIVFYSRSMMNDVVVSLFMYKFLFQSSDPT